mgnify:CR=1 FL=1
MHIKTKILVFGLVMLAMCCQAIGDRFDTPKYQCYWLQKPVAIRKYDDDGAVEIYVGTRAVPWDIWAGGRIKCVSAGKGSIVKDVAAYKLEDGSIVGVTTDGKWFRWHIYDGGSLGYFEDDPERWKEFPDSKPPAPDQLMTFEQGLLRHRLIWWGKVLGIAAIALVIIRKWRKMKRRLKAYEQAQDASQECAS